MKSVTARDTGAELSQSLADLKREGRRSQANLAAPRLVEPTLID